MQLFFNDIYNILLNIRNISVLIYVSVRYPIRIRSGKKKFFFLYRERERALDLYISLDGFKNVKI
jgi:hypothetical protein